MPPSSLSLEDVRGHACGKAVSRLPPDEIVEAKKSKKKKRNALVVCRDGKEFWTTQKQFWQWVREGVVAKSSDAPLAGRFHREHEELMVVVSQTLLDLGHPEHMREALHARRLALGKR